MRILTLLILLLAAGYGYAQDPVIQLNASIKDDNTGKKLGGVQIIVTADGKPFVTKTSASNGKIPIIDLPIGPVYMVKIVKPGYVTKMMKIDSHNDFPEDLPVFYEQPFETSLFEQVEGVDFSFLEREPMIEFSFDSQNLLTWDKAKLKIMQKKIENLKRQLEEKKAQEEAAKKEEEAKEREYSAYVGAGDAAMGKGEYEKAMGQYQLALDIKKDPAVQSKYDDAKAKFEDQKANAELEKKFGEKMAAAKQEFDSKNYEQALALYKEALKIKPGEQLPQDRITEINKIIQDIKNNQEQFNKLVAEGDKAVGSELYDDAISKYEGALKLIDDAAVKKKLEDAKAKKAAKEAANAELAAKKAEFDRLVAEADKLFDTKKYEESKSKYQEALGLIPGEKHPTDRISEIDGLLKKMAADEAAAKKLDQDFQNLITEADNLFEKQDWETAKTKYKAALDLKPGEQYPTDQIDRINKAMEQAKAAAEEDAKYKGLMDEANTLFNQKKYAEAKAKYQQASDVKKQEQEPKNKIAEIEKLLADEAKAAELEKQYQDLMTEGNSLMGIKDYTAALDKFKKALALKPEDAAAKAKIDEVNKLIGDLQAAEAKEKEFSDLVAKADQAFNAKDYHAAKTNFLKALDIKDDAGVKSKIGECDAKIKETEDAAALQGKYDAVIKEADAAFGSGDYQAALDKYQEAVAILDKDYPKSKIVDCKKMLEDAAAAKEKQENFNNLKAAGDKAYDEKNYQLALDKYKEAIAIKPDPSITKRIGELGTLIDQANAAQAVEDRYNAKIAEADAAFKSESWEEARALYVDAIAIMDKDYPKDQIKKIEENMKAESIAEIEAQYQKIITKADGLRDAESFDDAIAYYKRAQSLKKDDPYPQEQIDAITKLREDRASADADAKRRQETYDAAIKKADEAFNAQNWTTAAENYKVALSAKPDETYPQNQLDIIKTKIGELANLQAKEDEYNRYIKLGDDAFAAKDWKVAIKQYQEALEVMDKNYPKDQIQKAQDMMKAESENEIEEQYQKILEVAQKKFDERNYERALDLYIRAQTLKPEDPIPQQRIDEIKQILADLAHAAKNQDAYDKIISEADMLFRKEEWQKARDKYKEAYNLINEKYPKDQMKACEAHMREDASAEVHAQYNKIIAKADEYFKSSVYDKAKDLYQRAHNLMPSDQYPVDQLAEIDRLTNPKKYLAESNGMKYYGEPNRNTNAQDVEGLLLEAELQREWISNKRAAAQREENATFIGHHMILQENHNFETKGYVEQMETDIELAEWSAEVKRTEAEAEVIAFEQDVQETKREWARENDDAIHHQKQIVNQLELDIEEAKSDADVARVEYLGEVEEIVLAVKHENGANTDAQTNVIFESKDYVNYLQETHIVNDPNNDIARKNNEVYIEDYQVTIINKNKSDVWAQENHNYKTKDEAELLIDEIVANRVNDDIARVENVEMINDYTLELEDIGSDWSTGQYDANIDQKKYTENLVEEIELNNLGNDIPRQNMEVIVEDKELEVKDKFHDLVTNQNNVVMTSDQEIEELEILIEKNNQNRDKDREGFEETIEEVNLKIKDKNGDMAHNSVDESHNTVDHVEDMYSDKVAAETEADMRNDEATDATNDAVDLMIKKKQDLSLGTEEELYKTGNYVESLKEIDPKKITPEVQNSLGLEFPEGMTEEVYTLNDENGLMTAFVIRRVVVRNGSGNFFEKVQTRYGTVSYTMNGAAITEYQWQDYTEASDLVRN